jgi:hypothetical protein
MYIHTLFSSLLIEAFQWPITSSITLHSTYITYFTYTAKNDQVVAILFTVVNNIEQYCYTRFRLNNIVQYCWQVWTIWAAQHCSILLNSRLIIFTRAGYLSSQQLWYYVSIYMFILTHSVKFSCGRKCERRQTLFTRVRSANRTHNLKSERRLLWWLRHRSPLLSVMLYCKLAPLYMNFTW